jgi:hypothetical protein
MKAIESELGRSLDGTRSGGGSHIRHRNAGRPDLWIDDATHGDAMALLRDMGLDTELFEWPPASETASAAA